MLRQLLFKGIEAEIKHASVISPEEENSLWESGVLGSTSSKALLFTVFFSNGKMFCLCGDSEHKSLRLSQLKCFCDFDQYKKLFRLPW